MSERVGLDKYKRLLAKKRRAARMALSRYLTGSDANADRDIELLVKAQEEERIANEIYDEARARLAVEIIEPAKGD